MISLYVFVIWDYNNLHLYLQLYLQLHAVDGFM